MKHTYNEEQKEKIQKYADELAQQYFPDEANIWARGNIEAMFVPEACVRMAKYIEQELIKKADRYEMRCNCKK